MRPFIHPGLGLAATLLLAACDTGPKTAEPSPPANEEVVRSEATTPTRYLFNVHVPIIDNPLCANGTCPAGQIPYKYGMPTLEGWDPSFGGVPVLTDNGGVDLRPVTLAGEVGFYIEIQQDLRASVKFPEDVYQAVAIAVVDDLNNPPTPVFGSANWPAEFASPGIGVDLDLISFIDDDDDGRPYQYITAVNGPGNVRYVLDPTIINGNPRK